MGIIYTPPEPDHTCQPGTHVNGRGERVDTRIAVPGTRWQCDEDDCGKVWMLHEVMCVSSDDCFEWRRETRRELRQRRRIERARGG